MGVHIIRTIVYWGLYWGPLILGNYHIYIYIYIYIRKTLRGYDQEGVLEGSPQVRTPV